ncbi:hypothetical protein GCM10011381_00400 [Klenkia taihuensis]|nr:hypothetical protein GCM10011381_00400 [Klenkia taihuensis]
MNDTYMTAALVGGLVGALVMPLLVRVGLRQLRSHRPFGRWATSTYVATGFGIGAAAAGLSATRVDGALLPALVAWALALTALAFCDGAARRIPTALVRQAAVVVVLLLAVGSAGTECWVVLAGALAGALLLTGAFMVAWRYAGVGRGDVRLAVLSGLGLGFASPTSLVAGVTVWAAFVAGQSAVCRARGGSFATEIPMAPGFALGSLVAAIEPW